MKLHIFNDKLGGAFFFVWMQKKSEKDGIVKKAIDLEQIFGACSEATFCCYWYGVSHYHTSSVNV